MASACRELDLRFEHHAVVGVHEDRATTRAGQHDAGTGRRDPFAVERRENFASGHVHEPVVGSSAVVGRSGRDHQPIAAEQLQLSRR